MQFLLAWFSFVAVSVAVDPSARGPKYEELPNSEKIYVFRNPKSYDLIVTQIEAEEKAAKSGNVSKLSWLSPICISAKGEERLYRKCIEAFAKPFKSLFKLLQAIMPSAANPTDDVITKAAKDLSQAFRDIPIATVHEILYADTAHGFKKDINALKEVMSTRPIESGKQLLTKLGEKSKKLHCMALPDREREKSVECKNFILSGDFPTRFFRHFGRMQKIFEYMREEDNVVELAKNFAALMSALKQPSSYSDPDAFAYSIGKTTDFWKAVMNVVANVDHCGRETLVKQGKMNNIALMLETWLQYTNATVAVHAQQEEQATKIQTALYGAFFLRHFGSYTEFTNTTLPKFWKCMRSAQKVMFYESTALSNATLMTKEALDVVKALDGNAYAVLYLVNAAVTTLHRKQGLSSEAIAFYKTIVTVPNVLLYGGDFAGSGVLAGTSEAVLRKQKEVKATMLKQLNQLAPAKRQELVERFPSEVLSFIWLLSH